MKASSKFCMATLLALGLSATPLSAADPRSEEGASFEGRVTSVDTSAQTFTVGGETYYLLPTTRMANSAEKVSIDNVSRGQRVEGRYKLSSADRREVLTLQVSGDATASGSDQGTSFEGRVSSVDRSAQTITVDGETYHLLPTSRMANASDRASINNINRGQRVEGRYKMSAENRREILSLRVSGDAASGESRGTTSTERVGSDSDSSFQGRIERVNRSGQTLRVGNQTYHLLPTTRITRADGNTVAIADLKEEQRVSGTYRETGNGRRELLTLEVGRGANR